MNASFIERIEIIDHLIRIRGTGRPEELANRLNISVRTLYETLELLKGLGAPIDYFKS
jgi:predicted DNA-binding transcriptional regulator YafY